MRPCVVGIGGAGGNVLRRFLQSQDVNLVVHSFGEHLAYGDVKGIWLESASQDAQGHDFFGSLAEEKYPGHLICHDHIHPDSATKNYVEKEYGYDLKSQGFDRRAEYLKGVFEIFDLDSNLKRIASEEFNGEENPIPSHIWRRGIRPFTTLAEDRSKNLGSTSPGPSSLVGELLRKNIGKNGHSRLCDSILFVASLGGGTGTGFINPVTSYVRSEELAFPIFAMGILTEKGTDARHATEGQRDLGAAIAMYDLLTRPAGMGIDGLILVDNQILLERFSGNYPAMDAAIYSAMKPLLDLRNYPGAALQDDAPALRRVFWEAEVDKSPQTNVDGSILYPPLLVPCYYAQKGSGSSEMAMVERALGGRGRLFPCNPSIAERAYVFTRGYFQAQALTDAVRAATGITADKIKIYRKLGDGISDILILLRNPFGTPGDYKKVGTFERRMHDVLVEAIKYIEENQTNIIEYLGYSNITKEYLRKYFYGEQGLKEELKISLQRLKMGEKPLFINPLRIFGDELKAAAELTAEGRDIGDASPDQARIEDLVRSELKRLLNSEECRTRIKEIMKS